ncbi:hypothetical protein ABKN59_001140 [Abortiporus biennis]
MVIYPSTTFYHSHCLSSVSNPTYIPKTVPVAARDVQWLDKRVQNSGTVAEIGSVTLTRCTLCEMFFTLSPNLRSNIPPMCRLLKASCAQQDRSKFPSKDAHQTLTQDHTGVRLS